MINRLRNFIVTFPENMIQTWSPGGGKNGEEEIQESEGLFTLLIHSNFNFTSLDSQFNGDVTD